MTRNGEHEQVWDAVYLGKGPADLSWHQVEPELSLRLIKEFSPDLGSRIIDVGAGTSPLAGRLIDLGYHDITALDLSTAALSELRARLGERAGCIRFLIDDVLSADLPGPFDVWHDRAVFHFLTSAVDRKRYGAQARRNLDPGAHLILATFAPDGPEKCSGLPVCRYDAEGLARAMGTGFSLVAVEREVHLTPWGSPQPFTYAVLRRDERGA